MHEAALAQSVIAAIETAAARDGFARVERVVLEVGALSCVDADALAFGFDAASRGTLAADAALDIRRPPGRARCFGCDADVTIARQGEGCPDCGSHQLIVTGGQELTIKALEVV